MIIDFHNLNGGGGGGVDTGTVQTMINNSLSAYTGALQNGNIVPASAGTSSYSEGCEMTDYLLGDVSPTIDEEGETTHFAAAYAHSAAADYLKYGDFEATFSTQKDCEIGTDFNGISLLQIHDAADYGGGITFEDGHMRGEDGVYELNMVDDGEGTMVPELTLLDGDDWIDHLGLEPYYWDADNSRFLIAYDSGKSDYVLSVQYIAGDTILDMQVSDTIVGTPEVFYGIAEGIHGSIEIHDGAMNEASFGIYDIDGVWQETGREEDWYPSRKASGYNTKIAGWVESQNQGDIKQYEYTFWYDYLPDYVKDDPCIIGDLYTNGVPFVEMKLDYDEDDGFVFAARDVQSLGLFLSVPIGGEGSFTINNDVIFGVVWDAENRHINILFNRDWNNFLASDFQTEYSLYANRSRIGRDNVWSENNGGNGDYGIPMWNRRGQITGVVFRVQKITQNDYDQLVADDEVDENTLYLIYDPK